MLTKEQEFEIKKLKKECKIELDVLKSVQVIELQIAHLEKILRIYKRIHEIQTPSVADKLTLNMIKTQYKLLCTLKRIKPDKSVL